MPFAKSFIGVANMLASLVQQVNAPPAAGTQAATAPDAGPLARKRKSARSGDTLLTGPSGIEQTMLDKGKNTLLGM